MMAGTASSARRTHRKPRVSNHRSSVRADADATGGDAARQYGAARHGSGPLPSGAPALDGKNTYYFTGRSDNFDQLRVSTYPNDARFDPESVRVARNGKSVFITDEYGPYIYRFDGHQASGTRCSRCRINLRSVRYSRWAITRFHRTGGRVANNGMEGLAITPDGRTLVGIMQSPLIQDGGTAASTTRIETIDIETGAVTHEYAYKFDNIETD